MRPIYSSFESYAHDHPEGETFREVVTNGGRRDVILLPADTVENVLPGYYYWACTGQYPDNPYHKKRNRFYVHIGGLGHDEITHTYDTAHDAAMAFEALKALVPFCLMDLVEFGYSEWVSDSLGAGESSHLKPQTIADLTKIVRPRRKTQ